MNGMREKYPTEEDMPKEFINGTGFGNLKLKTYLFYITEASYLRGMAFTLAYNEAIRSADNKELCTCVGWFYDERRIF